VVAGAPLPNVDTSPMTLTVANGQAIQLTYEMLRELTPEQIYKIYQTYVKELSTKVVEFSKSDQQDLQLGEQVGPVEALACGAGSRSRWPLPLTMPGNVRPRALEFADHGLPFLRPSVRSIHLLIPPAHPPAGPPHPTPPHPRSSGSRGRW
jgi:hypothetical protein